jgi:hypothetical protein
MCVQQLNRLDTIADRLRDGGEGGFWPLSTGERLYVTLAANRADLMEACDYTVVQALGRIGAEWITELVRRWEYR